MKIPGGLETLRQSFRNRDYRLYVVGSISQSIGVWVMRMAMGWLTWELTESAAWLGAIVMAETAPTLVLSLIAGTLVDRVDYFKMLRICAAVRDAKADYRARAREKREREKTRKSQ